MRNDICFPCLEHPTRCFLLSVSTTEDYQQHALSCTRTGKIRASSQTKRTEQWLLVPEEADNFTSSQQYKIINVAHNRVLVSDAQGQLIAVPNNPTKFEYDYGCWSVEELDDDGVVRIKCFAGNCYLSCTQTPEETTIIQTQLDPECPTTQWKLDYLTGELCYIQLAGRASEKPKLLLCDNLGGLKMSNSWGGWEVWRFIEAGGNNQVRITSWTHQHKLLACDNYGKIQTTEDRKSESTLWTVRRAPKGLEGVIISSVPTGRLLRSDGTSLTSTGYLDGVATTWQLSSAHRQRYYLTSIGYDKRISLLKDNTLKTTPNRRDCEVWSLEKVANGFVQLRSVKFDKFLRYDGRGVGVMAREGSATSKWRISESPTGQGVCIVSAMEPHLALSCNQNGELVAVDHQGPFESWMLEPCMPRSLQGWQINLMIGGAVGAAVLGPALAVGALGLGAEGAAVGAVAAEAAVAGEVAVGATALETMGMAGLGLAMGTGAAVGLSATGIVVATSKRDRMEGTDLRQAEHDRPFCEWRSW